MEDYYKEVLGMNPPPKIWKRRSRRSYEYMKINVWPNIKLSDVKEKILAGDFKEAGIKLNGVKAVLAEFGKNYFSAAVYYPLERGRMLPMGPGDTYEFDFSDYMHRSFYTMNLMKMREKQLKGKSYEAKAIRRNLLDEEFLDVFVERTNCYREEKRKEKPAGKLQKIKNEILELAESAKLAFPQQFLIFPLSYMLLTKKNKGCPYQTSRFYSELLSENGERIFDDDEILSSPIHKELFLPNFGFDCCTPQELEIFEKVKNDKKEFDKISTHWKSEWVKIEK